eukprot:TRINITY_DN71277_c0_g1_i2.p1 TRINITY_DN71277_c0_g1~~TRINITY_DN71277_c0_g1_i2.p1  ORF type:complete len:212 (+),score=34.95 TRINITY_DN71277_c0_g1_i2:337-972(+)
MRRVLRWSTFDVLALAHLLEERCKRAALEGLADRVEEALSRLLVLRPKDPPDLLRQILDLAELLSVNPTVSLLVVDAMTSWDFQLMGLPRSSRPFLQEAWRCLGRLQQERSLALLACVHLPRSPLQRGLLLDTAGVNCCHLRLQRYVTALSQRTSHNFDGGGCPFGGTQSAASASEVPPRFCLVPVAGNMSTLPQAAFSVLPSGELVDMAL